jgi:hypothetical protein
MTEGHVPRNSPTAADVAAPAPTGIEPTAMLDRCTPQRAPDRDRLGTVPGDLGKSPERPLSVWMTTSVVSEPMLQPMLMVLSNPTRAMQMVDTLDHVFAAGEPDPATGGPLLAQLDTEILEATAS